jgi:SAM-dependent methyltransferase
MDIPHPTESGQAALWNGHAGHAWVEAQAVLDTMFEPFQQMLVDDLAAGAGLRVLDVGCGTGGTTRAMARRLGAGGGCLGVDISGPMIDAARERARQEGVAARFVQADAQRHAFEAASIDRIVSRFGVMFFDDPVAAFANLRHAARADAECRLVAWRRVEDNPFMTAAERAAAPLLPDLPARVADAPGQFAWADPARVAAILEGGGWTGIDIRPVDVACRFPERDLAGYFTRLGPVGRALQDADGPTRAQVVDTVRRAFAPHVQGDEVRFTAACWWIGARAGTVGPSPARAADTDGAG